MPQSALPPDIVVRARRNAESTEEQAKKDGQREREEMIERAKRDIQAETERSLDEIRRQVADLTVLATWVGGEAQWYAAR